MAFVFQQRFIHFYALNEVLNVFVIWYLAVYAPLEHYLPSLLVQPYWLGVFLSYVGLYMLTMVAMGIVLVFRQQFRPAGKDYNDATKPRFPLPLFQTSSCITRDGVELKVMISLNASSKTTSRPRKVMLLAAPLGQNGPALYNPIMARFGDEYVYITWDYRGFFISKGPKRIRRLSIPEHAQDAMEVLRSCGYEKANVMVGHSMGTAVSLEFALLFPENVDSLILVNGFHGHVFQTAFQPLVRIPFMGDLISAFVTFLLKHKGALESTVKVLHPLAAWWLPLYASWFGSPLMRTLQISGQKSYLLTFTESYFGGLFKSPQNLEHYLRLFQELNAHSVFHLLHSIEHPVLLLSGFLDLFTPNAKC
eukprot:m.130669 g.130669  ORF g.130669 m.130669 type:complete len:364 (-) comp29495_c0_seq3:395-1486(-)